MYLPNSSIYIEYFQIVILDPCEKQTYLLEYSVCSSFLSLVCISIWPKYYFPKPLKPAHFPYPPTMVILFIVKEVRSIRFHLHSILGSLQFYQNIMLYILNV